MTEKAKIIKDEVDQTNFGIAVVETLTDNHTYQTLVLSGPINGKQLLKDPSELLIHKENFKIEKK